MTKAFLAACSTDLSRSAALRHGTCSEETELEDRRDPRALWILMSVSLGTSTKQTTTAVIAEMSLQQKFWAMK